MSITLTAREACPASGLILLTMSLGVLIAQIDTSVVNLAVKPIGTDLKASVTGVRALLCITSKWAAHVTQFLLQDVHWDFEGRPGRA